MLNLKAIHKIGLFILFIVLLFIPHVVSSMSWHDSFNYRKLINVYNPNATSLENYQIRLSLHTGSGTDTGSDIYLNNNVLANFNDIRFTRGDETTLLDYWIESISSDTATVWVELNSLTASDNTGIYLYYGNASAASQSNAQATFAYFDNFDENGIAGWTGSEELVDHVQETGNQHQLVNSSVNVSSPNSAQMQTYASCLSGPFSGVRSLITASPALSTGNYLVEFDVKLQITNFRFSTAGVQRARVRINDVEKYYDEIACSGSGCTADGSWSNNSFSLTNTAINSIALVGDAYDCIEGNTFYDNVRVRHYVADQPTVLSVGGQTTFSPDPQPAYHAPETPSCSDTVVTAPELFQIDTTPTTAKLYFTPLNDTNQYFISYSTDPNAEEHGVLLDLSSEGVQSYTIDFLASGKSYYFKVRGQKGCMPGEWSAIKQTNQYSYATSTALTSAQELKNDSTLGASTSEITPTKKPPQPTIKPPSPVLMTDQKEENLSFTQKIATFFLNLTHGFK